MAGMTAYSTVGLDESEIFGGVHYVLSNQSIHNVSLDERNYFRMTELADLRLPDQTYA